MANWQMTLLITAIVIWLLMGAKNIPIGWRAQVLFMGMRTSLIYTEGWRWVFKPFMSMKPVDCRNKPLKLDPIIAITSDGVEVVSKEPSMVERVTDLNKYHDLDPETKKILLDDLVDQSVRQKVRSKDFATVIGMKFEVDEVAKKRLEVYGLSVPELVIPGFLPTDPEFGKAFELFTKEVLERKGEKEESAHIIDLINSFKTAGMSQGAAEEMAQLVTKKAQAKNITGFTVNPELVKAFVEAFVGRK